MTHEPAIPKANGNGEAVALPDGWRMAAIGDVCVDQTENRDPRRDPEAPFRYVDISSVDNQRKVITEARQLPGKEAPSRARQVIRTNDVLVATTRPNLNAVALVPAELDDAICSTGFCVLRSNGKVEPEFLFAFAQTEEFVRGLSEIVKGALYPAVTDGQVRGQKLPLPPLPEQRCIASRLREQLSAVAEARAAVQAQFDAARTLPAAHLRAVFNSAAASRWPKRRIGEVAKIQSGYAFKSEWFACDGIRLLRNANVSQDRIYWTDTARLPAARRAEFPTYELSEGDIILSLDRPVVSGGLKVARVSSGDLPALLLQRVGRFQLRDGIQANYLYHFLHTQEFIDEITAHDQSLGVPHVSPKQVEHVQLPVPPVAEQCTVAARIEAELGDARALATHLSARLAALNHLPAALLREAFRGRL